MLRGFEPRTPPSVPPPSVDRTVASAAVYRRAGWRRGLLRPGLERWIASNSSSERPEPTATHVSGDSARCAGICVSSRRRSSRPCTLQPPPPAAPLRRRAAARQHDAAVHDVPPHLGPCAVQRLLDGVDDLHQGLFEG